MELQHFFHPHPLTFIHYQAYTDSISSTCKGCCEEILGFSYWCKGCKFFLHKSCCEQSRELKYPLHPQHLLILQNRSQYYMGFLDDGRCNFCNKHIRMGYFYQCPHCDFNLHLKCASIPFTVKAEFHGHPLQLLRKSVSFTCDACGKKDEDMYSYLCTSTLTCSLMVHLKCAALPLTVKNTSHCHALNLTQSSKVSNHRICLLCVKKAGTDKVYYCSKCNFVTHLDCATREGDTEEINQPLESIGMLKNEDSEVLDEAINDSLAYAVKKITMGEDKIEIVEEINHFSHQHDLKLIDELLINNEKCDGCMYPIFPPFYICAQCRFFLHKSCVELPRKKQHPFHPHLLALIAKSPYGTGTRICNVCRLEFDGFGYHCKKCEFDVDVQCSLISNIFTHDGHDHPLILSRAPYDEKCSCCDCVGKVFKCADCEFTLDVVCGTLPLTVRYRSFEQLFKLCYNAEDGFDGEYYCDICEDVRDPKHWFYYCIDLSFSAHPYCIL